jgi:hypothetical protein
MRKKKQPGITSEVRAAITPPVKGRQWRERLTRVGVVTSPVKGKDTNAKQWNRWTP